MARCRGVRLLLVAALGAAFGARAEAQGGWRQWDVHLRDGTRIEANPLGAPDDSRVSHSVGAYEGHEPAIPRERIDYLAARLTGERPAPPTASVREDLIVYRDGRRTKGRVTLGRIIYSEGVVRQRGKTIDLEDVAYIKFAAPKQGSHGR
jgi:hypothetical protein